MARNEAANFGFNIVKTSSLSVGAYGNILIGLTESPLFTGFRPRLTMPLIGKILQTIFIRHG